MKGGKARSNRQSRAFAALSDAAFDRLLQGLPAWQLEDIKRDWSAWGRPEQKAPEGDWATWLIMAGRGFGKTRAGAEWVRALAEREGALSIALVGATMAEARAVMVEGESGLLAIASREGGPRFEISKGRLLWSNGSEAHLYSAAEPESLRGPSHHFAWCDEIGKWPHGIATWDNLMMGLRRGERPRVVATTTPRNVPLVCRLHEMPGVAITRGATYDNQANLPPAFLAAMEAAYGGTRIGRQELDGELIGDAEGALWTRALIEAARMWTMPVARVRVVIGVDPPAGASAASDACGIVAVALGADGRAYVLDDASIQGATPEGWARTVALAAARWGADRVVAEANNGGAMVESVLRVADNGLPVRLVHASHGKVARAEPVSVLYEKGRVSHVGAFPALEDEMCGLAIGGAYEGPGRSPDRADALVWALTELMLKNQQRPGVRVFG
jgi:phage terminase large subunit-like protein